MINLRRDADALAQSLRARAVVTFDQAAGELTVQLQLDTGPLPRQLQLELSHPARAVLDHHTLLTRVARNHYRAQLSQSLRHRWYLRLTPVGAGEAWRLRGEIDFTHMSAVTLGSVDNSSPHLLKSKKALIKAGGEKFSGSK